MADTELAGLVGARICHDIANPVGAIVNGTDLLREISAIARTEEFALVEQSARRAAALLQFHRLAFAPPRETDAVIARRAFRERVSAALFGPKLELTWAMPDGPDLPVGLARLVSLMVLACRTMLGGNGRLSVSMPADAILPAEVTAEGIRAGVSPAQRGWLAGDYNPLPDSRQVEFALMPLAAAAAKARVDLGEANGQVTLRAAPA